MPEPVDCESITKERLSEWAARLVAANAEPILLLGIRRDERNSERL